MYRGFEIQEVVERKLLATKWNSDEEIIAMFSEEDMTELRKQIDMWHQDQEELAKLWRQINER